MVVLLYCCIHITIIHSLSWMHIGCTCIDVSPVTQMKLILHPPLPIKGSFYHTLNQRISFQFLLLRWNEINENVDLLNQLRNAILFFVRLDLCIVICSATFHSTVHSSFNIVICKCWLKLLHLLKLIKFHFFSFDVMKYRMAIRIKVKIFILR